MEKIEAHDFLVPVVKELAKEKRAELERLKQEYSGLSRPDFIWHYLLQSFSTMGRAAGWAGLIGNKNNYNRVTYNTLAALSPAEQETQIRQVCQEAKIRMPDKKADYILGCFDYVKKLGGLEVTKTKLLTQPGREAKIRFLQNFPGIGPKYARNIMMDVYHEDFRDSIAIDVRIKAISEKLGLSFLSYTEHESFFLGVARDAGINGWELDRLLFNFNSEVESMIDGHFSCNKNKITAEKPIMTREQNAVINSNAEESIIAILKKIYLVDGLDVTDARCSVALYITGLSAKKVKDHIKKRTFSGANALEHISRPNTPAAISAWIRGKTLCRAAGLPIRRLRWEDRFDEDLLNEKLL
jgi:thermostable 8-oxoguanine DNA glycosylase